MLRPTINLLRRTFAVSFAIAAATFSSGAFAQTTYSCSQPTISPGGSFSITCNPASGGTGGTGGTGGGTTTAGGTFSLSGPSLLTAPFGGGTVTVARAGGTTGGYSMDVVTVGNCGGAGTVTFADGASSASGVAIVGGGAVSASYTPSLPCTITLQNLRATAGTTTASPPATIGTPSTLSLTVTAPVAGGGTGGGTGGTGGGGTTPGCPALPSLYQDITLANAGASGPWTAIDLPNGGVGSTPLPPANDPYNGGTWRWGGYSRSPSGSLNIEVTISKCKGEINPNAGTCYYTTPNGDYQSLSWVSGTTPYNPATFGACDARGGGQWYLNIKYSYGSCLYPPACGFQWVWYNFML